jgi:hypothetical protein
MQTKVVEYWNGTVAETGKGKGRKRKPDIRIVVREANAMDGITRAVLQGTAESWLLAHGYVVEEAEAEAEAKAEGQEAEGEKARTQMAAARAIAARLAARIVYPDLMSTVAEAEGIDPDLSLDAFLELPDTLTGPWQEAVYELNPHWLTLRPATPEQEEAEKKG